MLLAAFAVWLFGSDRPDLLIAVALLVLFLRSTIKVLCPAWREAFPAPLRH